MLLVGVCITVFWGYFGNIHKWKLCIFDDPTISLPSIPLRKSHTFANGTLYRNVYDSVVKCLSTTAKISKS